jgi:hypothetical protein
MIDVSALTTEELTALASGIQDELMARQEKRQLELIDDLIKAFHTLVKECPGVRLTIERQCHDCGCWSGVDVMSYFGTALQPSNFDL